MKSWLAPGLVVLMLVAIGATVPLALLGIGLGLELRNLPSPQQQLEGRLWWLGASLLVVATCIWLSRFLRGLGSRFAGAAILLALIGSAVLAFAVPIDSDFSLLVVTHSVGVALLVAPLIWLQRLAVRAAGSCPGILVVVVSNWAALFLE